MEKKRKIKVIAIVALVAGLLAITVAFAALSGTLKINGSGKMDPANWDIHFKNVKFVGKSETASTSGTPAPTNNDNGPTIEGLNVTLKQPNDYVTYTADIKNEGDIDASIDVVTPPSLTDRQSELFTFEAEYTDIQDKGSKLIEHGDMLRAGETKNITITFRYNDISDASKLPSSPEEINLTYSILYVQAFESSTTEEEPSGSAEEAGHTYELGDKFCLNNNTECFYTITDNGDTVTAISEWNLDTNSGIQSSSSASVINFSETSYWSSNNDGDFVYNSNSNLWTPVQNYQTYLRNTLGKTSVSTTILSLNQAIEFATAMGGFENLPTWAFQPAYWLGNAKSGGTIYAITPQYGISACEYNDGVDFNLGIRPVITINKSEI